MPSILAYRPLRLFCDFGNPNRVLDQRTNLPPVLTRGSATGFELGLGVDGALFSGAISGTASSLTVQLRASEDPASAISLEGSVAAVALNDALTQAAWDGKTAQHALVQFATTECNIAAAKYWLAIWMTTPAGQKIIVLAGYITVVENGAAIGSTPATVAPGYSTTEADARFAQLNPALGAYRVKDTGTGVFLQLKDSATGLYSTVFLTGGVLQIAAGEA